MKHAIIFTAVLLALAAGVAALAIGPMTLGQLADASDDPVFYNELGYQLAQDGRLIGAQAAFARAVELDPSYESARKNLAVSAFRNQDYLTAIEHYRILAAAGEAQYRFDLAQSLVAHARYAEQDLHAAVTALEEAATILESLGGYSHAAENAAIVRAVLAEQS